MENWDNSIHDLLRPNSDERYGNGILSMIGAHTNLKEYPRAAQLKNVTEDFFTPASVSQIDNVPNISKIGIPADIPRKNIVITRGCSHDCTISFQVRFTIGTLLIIVFTLKSDYAVIFTLEMLRFLILLLHLSV